MYPRLCTLNSKSCMGQDPKTCYKQCFIGMCSLCLVAQSCQTLCDPRNVACQASLCMGIFQTRIVEWVAMSFSRGFSQRRNRTQVSHMQADCLPSKLPEKPKNTGVGSLSLLQGGLLDPIIELGSPAMQVDYLPPEIPGKPFIRIGIQQTETM